jgi:DNA-binding FadR family transcriptional regulator
MTDMFHFAYPNSEGRNEAFECHIRILQAIRGKSPEGAREAMSYHLERSEINTAHLARQSPRSDQSGRDDQGSRDRAARSENAG